MASAAVNVSVGALPVAGAAAVKSLPHTSAETRVAQPASTLANVAKLAIVGVWLLLSGSCITSPHPPVARSTKFGTFPAAIRSPSA